MRRDSLFFLLFVSLLGCGRQVEDPNGVTRLLDDRDTGFGFKIFGGDATGYFRFTGRDRIRDLPESFNGSPERGGSAGFAISVRIADRGGVRVRRGPPELAAARAFAREAARDRAESRVRATRSGKTQKVTQRYQDSAAARKAIEKEFQEFKERRQHTEREVSVRSATQKMVRLVNDAAQRHNESVKLVLKTMDHVERMGSIVEDQFRTPLSTPAGQAIRDAARRIKHASTLKTPMPSQFPLSRARTLAVATTALRVADHYYADGDRESAHFALEINRTFLEMGLGLIPGIGWGLECYGALTGYSLITGKKLMPMDHAWAIIGAATFGFASKLKLLKNIKVLARMGVHRKALAQAKKWGHQIKGLGRFGPLRRGKLHGKKALRADIDDVAETFQGRRYFEILTDQEIKLYRVYDGAQEAGQIGAYWSRVKPSSSHTSLDLLLDSGGGGVRKKWVEITVPPGNVMYEGAASRLWIKSRGLDLPANKLYGGGNQIWLDDVTRNWVSAGGGF